MKYRVSPDALMQKVGEESVILDLRGGTYFGLDPIGTCVWEALAAGSSLDALVDMLANEYEVAIDTLRDDIEKLLAELRANGLVAAEE
jgi:hypothetical protein